MTTPEAHTYRDALILKNVWMSESISDGAAERVSMMIIRVIKASRELGEVASEHARSL
jgi:hypothetical protein